MNRERVTIFIALGLSLLIHIILVPAIFAHQPLTATGEQTKSTHIETPDRDVEERLGIDESKSSTLTWIGYKEYELHRAQESIVEQAATTTTKQKPAPTHSIQELLQDIQVPVESMTEQLLQAIGELHISIPTRDLPPSDTPVVEVSEATVEVVIEEDDIDDGVESDSDSIPTSIVRVNKELWKSGKPIAGEGVVLKPRKPSFTSQQMVSNSPSDLLVELHIDRDGKPSDVVLLIGTGSPSIDRTLISSLYRWRASGEHIDAMGEDDVFKIVVHLTFAR